MCHATEGASSGSTIDVKRRRKGVAMNRSLARRGLIFLAVSLVFATSTVALAASWDDTCNASGDACIWKNGPFVVPLAATTTSDNTYTNDLYPNTQATLNDSASSLKNKFDVHDVVWFIDADYAGDSICVDHNTGVGSLGPTFNDEISSHAVTVGSTC
jgi:hypothetical protein